MIEEDFLACARMIGVERRIAALIVDCDRALAEGLKAPRRRRLLDQRQRLIQPDLALMVSLTTLMAEETPSLAPFLAAALRPLAAARDDLKPFLHRLDTVETGFPVPRPEAR